MVNVVNKVGKQSEVRVWGVNIGDDLVEKSIYYVYLVQQVVWEKFTYLFKNLFIQNN